MEKAYNEIIFKNNQSPDLDEDNLNRISRGLSTVDDRVIALSGDLTASDRIIRNVLNTNIVANMPWVQGGYGSIGNYGTPNPNTYAYRIRGEIVFDEPIHIKSIKSVNPNYQYGYAAFDVNNARIGYNASWTNNLVENLNGVKTLRLQIKDTNDTSSGHKVIGLDSVLDYGVIVEAEGFYNDFNDVISHSNDTTNALNYIINAGEWVQGSWVAIASYLNPQPNETYRRCRLEKVFDTPKNIKLTLQNDKYDFYYYGFDVNGNIVGHNSYGDTIGSLMGVKTLRILVKNKLDAAGANVNTYVADINKVGVMIEELESIPTKLRIMTYNIGRFSYGVEPKYLAVDYDEKLANYKKFFSNTKADIIGMQECNDYLDGATTGTITADSEIFSYLYPDVVNNNGNVCIKSKYPLLGKQTIILSTGRRFAFSLIAIGNRLVMFGCVHLTPNSGAENDAKRRTEAQEIVDIISAYDYAIVCGDFNASNEDGANLFKIFTNANYKLANGGYLPMEWTYSFNPADFDTDTPSDRIRYFDNIVVSNNIIVENSTRLNVYHDLSSDHIPFIADLLIL